jgi:hypothetical protein
MAGSRSQSLESLLHRDCEKKTERGGRRPGQVLGDASGTRVIPYLSANPILAWLKADVGSDLAINGIFPLLTTESKQMHPLPAPALERTQPELPARSNELATNYRQEAHARLPPPMALYRDLARTGGGSVPERASPLDAIGDAVNTT